MVPTPGATSDENEAHKVFSRHYGIPSLPRGEMKTKSERGARGREILVNKP